MEANQGRWYDLRKASEPDVRNPGPVYPLRGPLYAKRDKAGPVRPVGHDSHGDGGPRRSQRPRNRLTNRVQNAQTRRGEEGVVFVAQRRASPTRADSERTFAMETHHSGQDVENHQLVCEAHRKRSGFPARQIGPGVCLVRLSCGSERVSVFGENEKSHSVLALRG